MEPDPGDQARLLGARPQPVEHLLLHVHGDDRTGVTHHLGQRQSEETGSAAEVDGHVPLVDESPEDPPGIVEQPAGRVREPTGVLRRTDVFLHDEPPQPSVAASA